MTASYTEARFQELFHKIDRLENVLCDLADRLDNDEVIYGNDIKKVLQNAGLMEKYKEVKP